MWLRGLFLELEYGEMLSGDSQVKTYSDSQCAMNWAEVDGYSIGRKAKHIDVRIHFARECVEDKTIDLEYVPSADNVSDMFTKPLGRVKFEKFRRRLGICASD